MTPRSSTAEPVPVGWPGDPRQVADEAEAREVSRETSTGLGWPEFTE